MRKRIILLVILAFVLITCIFSASLEVFELTHPVYELVETLYVMEGKASPMGAKPWTHADVKRLTDAVEPSGKISRDIRDMIQGYIKEDDGLIFNAVIEPQLMIHTNEAYKERKSIAAADLLDRQFAVLGLGYRYKDNMALYMDTSLSVTPSDVHHVNPDLSAGASHGKRISSSWGTNIPFLPDGLNIMNFPNNAYLALGNSAFRAVAGRGQVEWGNGVLGNMIIGNTLPYHDYLSLTFTGSDEFSYQLLTSFFSHSQNKENDSDRRPLNGIRFFLGHRFEFTLIKGKLQIVLNDSLMYQSENNYLDLRLLNPLFFLHNGFMAGNSNSLASLEIEYSPIKNISIYGQFALDDYAVFGEPKPGEDGGSADGLGAMLGIRGYIPAGNNGLWHGNAEFVYTSPYIYHRAMEYENRYTRELYFVSSIRYMDGGQSYLERYLSFPFGSDAIAGVLSIGYEKPGLFDVTGRFFVMAHGVIDEYSSIRQYHGGEPVTNTPSTSNPLGTGEDKGGVAEYTVVSGIDAVYYLKDWLPINAGINLLAVWNQGNYSAPVKYDVQFNLGFSLKY